MIYACDVETTGLDFTISQLICFAYWSPTESGVLTDCGAVEQWCEQHHKDTFIWQNGKFDQKVIQTHCKTWVQNDFDTLLAASLLPDKPQKLDLESLAQNYLGVTPFKLGIGEELDRLKKYHQIQETREEHKRLLNIIQNDNEKIEEIKTYCLADCEPTYKLFEQFMPALHANNQLIFFNQYLMPLANLLAQVEYWGIGVNTPKLQAQWLKAISEITQYKETLYEKYFDLVKDLECEKLSKYKRAPADKTIREKIHFNWGSRDQKLWLLKEKLGFPCVDFKGKESVKGEVLEEYIGKHPIIDDLLNLEDLIGKEEAYARYSEHTRSSRIHTNFSLTLRNSGRLSSSEPPLQNVDKDPEIRSIFSAKEGHILVVSDFSQIEPALMAHFSQDQTLLWAFNNFIDYYLVVTAKLLGLSEIPDKSDPRRKWGKIMGLALPYGMGLKKIGRSVENQTGEKCDYRRTLALKDIYFNSFPGVTSLIKNSFREAQEKGYVDTLFGRRQYISKYDSENKPINRKIQTSASDLACFSQLWVKRECEEYNIPATLVHLVHDEVIYEVPIGREVEFAQLLDTVMCHGWKKYAPEINLTVPLSCEIFIGQDWSCKK